jgi:hypothetical protein
MKQMDEHVIRAGIKLIASKPVAVGIDVPLTYANHTGYTRGLVLKSDGILNYVTSIIVNEDFFAENDKVKLVQQKFTKHIQLVKHLPAGGCYRSFHFYLYD